MTDYVTVDVVLSVQKALTKDHLSKMAPSCQCDLECDAADSSGPGSNSWWQLEVITDGATEMTPQQPTASLNVGIYSIGPNSIWTKVQLRQQHWEVMIQ